MSTYKDRGWKATTERPTKKAVYYTKEAVDRKYIAGFFTGMVVGLLLGILLIAL